MLGTPEQVGLAISRQQKGARRRLSVVSQRVLDLGALVAIAVVLVEHLLAQADRFRRHFHQLIVVGF